jgi:hypothetical protein
MSSTTTDRSRRRRYVTATTACWCPWSRARPWPTRCYNLQDRGRLFVDPNIEVYEGQIVGLHSRGNDLPVNPTKAKQLTNIRAAGTDEALILTPPVRHSLEQALEFIDDDELVEVTPRASACARSCSRSTSASAPRAPRRLTDAGAPAARARGQPCVLTAR